MNDDRISNGYREKYDNLINCIMKDKGLNSKELARLLLYIKDDALNKHFFVKTNSDKVFNYIHK